MLSGQHGATCKKTLGQDTPVPSLSYYITEAGRDQINDISIMGHPLGSIAVCPTRAEGRQQASSTQPYGWYPVCSLSQCCADRLYSSLLLMTHGSQRHRSQGLEQDHPSGNRQPRSWEGNQASNGKATA